LKGVLHLIRVLIAEHVHSHHILLLLPLIHLVHRKAQYLLKELWIFNHFNEFLDRELAKLRILSQKKFDKLLFTFVTHELHQHFILLVLVDLLLLHLRRYSHHLHLKVLIQGAQRLLTQKGLRIYHVAKPLLVEETLKIHLLLLILLDE